MSNCPICNQPIIKIEKKTAPYLLIYEPTNDERKKSSSIGEWFSLPIAELGRTGMGAYEFCKTPVWLHPKGSKVTKLDKDLYKGCENHFLQQIMELGKNKLGIFIMGAEATKILTGEKVSEWSGLNIPSPYFDAPVIICSEKPAKTIGELRLAITRFVKQIETLTQN